MSLKTSLLFFFFCFFSSFVLSQKESIDLGKASSLVLKNAASLASLQKKVDAIKQKSQSLDKIYNLNFINRNSYTYDRSASNQIVLLDSSEQFLSSFELNKLFSSGALGKIKASIFRLQNEYSANNPSSVSSFEVPNSYETKLEFEVSQPLLRNWMTPELSLQKEIVQGGAIEPNFQHKILAQTLSYTMENLFINLSSFAEQIKILKSMKKDLENVTALTKSQLKLGRAEEMNVIKSEYKIVAFDMRLQELLKQQEDIKKKILLKCGFDKNFELFKLEVLNLRSFSLDSSLDNFTSAYRVALEKRQDLKKLQKLENPIYHEIRLLKEKNRSSLDFFVNYGVNGQKDNLNDSFKQMKDFSKSKVTVGVNFSMTFGGDAYRSESLSFTHQIDALALQRKDLLEKLKEDLELAYHKLSLIDKKIKLNKLRAEILKKQCVLEKIKFKQAREERLSLVLTQIEAKDLTIEGLSLLQEKLLTAAQIKFLTHSYKV